MVAIDNNRAIISLTCLFGLVKRDAAMFCKGSKGQIKREVPVSSSFWFGAINATYVCMVWIHVDLTEPI